MYIYNNTYYPIQWNLSANLNGNGVSETGTLDQCITALESAVTKVEAGSPISVQVDLSWVWVFENGDQSCGVKFDGNAITKNMADTFLGILASESVATNGFGYDYSKVSSQFSTNSKLKVGFENFVVSIEQIQNNA